MKMMLRMLAGVLIAVAAALTAPVSAQKRSPALRTITITAPANDDTVHSNRGNLRVAVTVAPRLAANETIVISLDNREAARGARRHLQLSGIERGTHLLQARLLDASGNTLAQSDVVTFHLWQASRLYPTQRK